MADPFVAEIRIFPFNFAPKGWAWCDGQLLPISQNTALFSLLGTIYGGNGKSNFALPDLMGRAPMQFGRGPGLSERRIGEMAGSETVTLTTNEMPSHQHSFSMSVRPSDNLDPSGLALGTGNNVYAAPGTSVTSAANNLAQTGGNQAHNNMQPYITYYFNIALQGVYPPRS